MAEPRNFWQRFLARPNDDRIKTVSIAVIRNTTVATSDRVDS